MKYVDLEIALPDALLHPMQAFIRRSEAVDYEEMLAWRVRPELGVEYALYYVEADLDPYRAAVADVDSIIETRIAPIDDRAAHVWAKEESRPETQAWRQAFADRQVIVVPPIRYDETAAMAMTIVGDGRDINELTEAIPESVEVSVLDIGTYDRRGGTLAGALTGRQLEAVGTAVRLGYYAVPRQASLADVAGEIDCAESTASVLLRRAEREIFTRILDRYGGTEF